MQLLSHVTRWYQHSNRVTHTHRLSNAERDWLDLHCSLQDRNNVAGFEQHGFFSSDKQLRYQAGPDRPERAQRERNVLDHATMQH